MRSCETPACSALAPDAAAFALAYHGALNDKRLTAHVQRIHELYAQLDARARATPIMPLDNTPADHDATAEKRTRRERHRVRDDRLYGLQHERAIARGGFLDGDRQDDQRPS